MHTGFLIYGFLYSVTIKVHKYVCMLGYSIWGCLILGILAMITHTFFYNKHFAIISDVRPVVFLFVLFCMFEFYSFLSMS